MLFWVEFPSVAAEEQGILGKYSRLRHIQVGIRWKAIEQVCGAGVEVAKQR